METQLRTMAKRKCSSWLQILVHAAIVSITIFAVINLDRPRFGLVRLTAADNALVQLRASMRQLPN